MRRWIRDYWVFSLPVLAVLAFPWGLFLAVKYLVFVAKVLGLK